MIEVKNLTKRYGSNIALDNISFSVEEGKHSRLFWDQTAREKRPQ